MNLIERMRRCRTQSGLDKAIKGVNMGRGKRRVYAEMRARFAAAAERKEAAGPTKE